MKGYYFFILGMILCLTSCKNNPTSTIVENNVNSPVTINVTNSFTYNVNANQYTDNSINDLNFLSDSLVVTLTASSYL